MLSLSRSIALLICLTVLCASFAQAQKKQDAEIFPCQNQEKSAVDFVSFGEILGAVESVEAETTLVSVGPVAASNNVKPMALLTYKYDRQGRLLEANVHKNDRSPMLKTTFEYDSENKPIKHGLFFAAARTPFDVSKYIYNSDGTVKEINESNARTNEITGKKVFSYDSKKNYYEITESKFDTGQNSRSGFTLDDKCRVLETVAYQTDGKIIQKTVTDFDDEKNLAFTTVYSKDGSVFQKVKHEYEFDNRGNWVKKFQYLLKEEKGKSDWSLEHSTYRKIKYFDTK